MKRRKVRDRIATAAVAVLFVCLCLLTAALISVIRLASGQMTAFDLTAVTADRSEAATDISDCLLPGFAGVTAGGMRLGLVGSKNAMNELCDTLYPS